MRQKVRVGKDTESSLCRNTRERGLFCLQSSLSEPRQPSLKTRDGHPYHVQTALPPLGRHRRVTVQRMCENEKEPERAWESLSTCRQLVPQPLGMHVLPADVIQTWGSGFPDQSKQAPTAELMATEERPLPWCANLYYVLIEHPLNICVYKLTMLFRLKYSHWHSHCFYIGIFILKWPSCFSPGCTPQHSLYTLPHPEFTVALFTIEKNWNQPSCLSTDKWISHT